VSRSNRERGSASIWVIACCALLLAITFASTMRTAAVVARHRAESAADLAALAAAGQIGVSHGICPAAVRIAAANGASVQRCAPSLAPGGRSQWNRDGLAQHARAVADRRPEAGGRECARRTANRCAIRFGVAGQTRLR